MINLEQIIASLEEFYRAVFLGETPPQLNLPILIMSLCFFAFIILSYTIEKLDFVAISLISAFICALITGIMLQLGIETFIGHIEFEAILIILSMSIITKIAEDSNILEYLAVKLFKISGGNQYRFFYFVCIITTLLAAIITDVVVVLIIAPVVIRLCHFLKIRSGTYLMGMTICINIGSIITPFSSGENIIISTAFNLDTLYFIENFWIFSFALLFLTIYLLDRFYLRKEPKIEAQQKKLIIELIDTDTVVKNKKMFIINSIGIIITIVLFALLPLLYITAIVSAMILVLINRGFTKKSTTDLLKDVEWEVIFFFISLYIVVGCLLEAGFQQLFAIEAGLHPILLGLIIVFIVSALSGAVANTPTALIFIPIVQSIINAGYIPAPILFAFIIGINLGGNFLPQGAACDLMTLKIARDSGVENLNYKRLLKNGSLFAFIHLGVSILYLIFLTIIKSL
ncbi:MAG: Arsenical pump membrane protein [Promethearchaeota archaeon]|nr:MAG: Arsenical pump membrane protein [Candidatus Lokiarchaeota archaeon]